MSNGIKQLTIKELTNSDNYVVPIYQRNYAWGKEEIDLLLDDIWNAFETKKKNNYYIGSLIVFKRNTYFEVIDGQQRLTTLRLLLTALEKNNIKLSFEHRDASNNSLNNLKTKIGNTERSINIDNGFSTMKQKISVLKEKHKNDYEGFEDFLLNKVVILRTEVPPHTDLNHYFEIMNNRGEQLEKHEVLKARLMSLLDKNNDSKEQQVFSMIWNACSDMSIYVQKGFPFSSSDENSLRTKIFGDYCDNSLAKTEFKEILDFYQKDSNNDSEGVSLKSILIPDPKEEIKLFKENNISKEDKLDSQFDSIIDFPNFLMHVLRIYLNNKEIPLNDKELINQFGEIKTAEDVKKFIMVLLRVRLLFDRYIIKSQSNIEDGWVLRGLKKYHNSSKNYYYFKEVDTFGSALNNYSSTEESDNKLADKIQRDDQKTLIMLLSMFHVSFRQRIYKEWLYEVLNELYQKSDTSDTFNITAKDYIALLEEKANKYYQSRNAILSQLGKDKNINGTSVQNYIFNYLDYLIWRNEALVEEAKKFLTVDEFKFSLSRNSVEHYLAQNKSSELKNPNLLDNFGNLCLISNYQNSSLSDGSCDVKKARYKSDLKCTSLKQAIMLSYPEWTDKEIKEHDTEMRDILFEQTKKYLGDSNE